MIKNDFKLQPEREQELQAIMALPWTPKLFYGIIADSFPICGSRKKNYIIVTSVLQCICALAIATINFNSASPIAALGFVITFSGAMLDVVIDGLMVQ